MRLTEKLELIKGNLNGILIQQPLRRVTKRLLENDIDNINKIIKTLRQ